MLRHTSLCGSQTRESGNNNREKQTHTTSGSECYDTLLCVALRRVNHATTTERKKHTQLLDPSVTAHFLCVALRRMNQATTTDRNKHTTSGSECYDTLSLCGSQTRESGHNNREKQTHTTSGSECYDTLSLCGSQTRGIMQQQQRETNTHNFWIRVLRHTFSVWLSDA